MLFSTGINHTMAVCIRLALYDELVSANGSPYVVEGLRWVAKNWDFMPMTNSLN